tara:strand:+ start:5378 stop:6121 length:744 start_codon:yes stop_codon:yes gene_type:complete
MIFSFKNYSNLLKKINKTKKIILFSQYNKRKNNFLILRHDIEYFLEPALKLAEIEKKNNVKSTFFFQTTSIYNIFENENFYLIKKIKKLGHDFGVHYDAHFLKENKLDNKKSLSKMIDSIEYFFNIKIKAISCHRPKKYYFDPKYKNTLNVYDKNFLKNVKYISDSQQVFRDNIFETLSNFNKIQLLVHDYTWSKKGKTWQKNIKDYFINNFRRKKIYFNKTILDWEKGLKMRSKQDKKMFNKFLNK